MHKYYLGVDVGGTKIAVCGSNYSDISSGCMRIPTVFNSTANVEKFLLSTIEKYVREYENNIMPAAIGFGLKDAVDSKNCIWLKCPCQNGFEKMDFLKRISKPLSLPVLIDNDVHVATYAELKYGAGRKYRNFLYFNVGTGISMGIVADGIIIHGSTNYAGEIGHMTVESDGEKCNFCGNYGCLENIASGAAIIEQAMDCIHTNPESEMARIYNERGYIGSKDVFKLSEVDEGAKNISTRVLRAMEYAVSSIVNIFNPEAVIFGGGVMSDNWLCSRLQSYVPNHVIPNAQAALHEISLSSIGSDYVGVIGAMTIAEYGI